MILSLMSVVTSLGLTAVPAAAAPPTAGGGGGGKPTTTSSSTTTTLGGTTTTVASTSTGGGGASPKLTAVTALSRHRVLATYDRDLDAAALEASSYAFSSTAAVNLPVLGVSRATNNQAFVLTAAQEPVTYEVKKPKTPRPITFTGSTTTEPKVVSATPVSSTQIIVTFSEAVGTSAVQPSAYQLTVEGSTTALAVTGAAVFGSSQTQVLLTTAPQEAVPYVLKVVGDIQGLTGAYMDPTAISMQLSGSTVPAGPMLLSATPQGDTGLLLTFDTALDPSATEVSRYTATPGLTIKSAVLQSGNTQVLLTTGPQYAVSYTIVADVVDATGRAVNQNFNTVTFTGSIAISHERPKVVSAGSTGNTSVVVQFSKPMADNAIDKSHYAIVQTVVHPEVGTVGITAATFVDAERLSVALTTESQAEVTYQVTAHNVTDMAGNPLADKTNVAGVVVDPTSFTFPGTPPTGDERTNSDDDTLWDHEETRGWQITIKLANGQTQTRQVTSSLYTDDTDDDRLLDHEERALNIDPRDHDTDDDGLTDWMEFNEFYSDPANQDSDGDSLFDGLEATFFMTSPIFDDTDGDQLKDDYEINVNRNPKVADLPQPMLTLGDMRLSLDVKYTESNGTSSRELDSKTVQSTLTQSKEQLFSRSESTTHEVATKAGLSVTAGIKKGFEALSGPTFMKSIEVTGSTETTNTNSFSSSFTDSSSAATQEAYSKSLSTEQEVAKDSNVTRDVYGARVQLGVFLEGRGNVAFTVRNLQVAALIQDPDDPSRLTPITTLTPAGDPAASFNLGPLVPPKGPIVFTSTDASPELVEELMRNPRGLVFRFSNYDVVDEAGRNFAFTSQDVNDRTARIAIDYGGFDADGDGQGEETEILRVATGVKGRHVEDTDQDGDVDQDDRKVVFDLKGKQVGITLRDALEAAGLTWYDEDTTPSETLDPVRRRNSFSTRKPTTGQGELIFRLRDRQIRMDSPRQWLVITPFGIDPLLRLDERILYPGSNVTFAYVQDEDEDRLPALVEAMNGCTDGPQKSADGRFLHRDTDGDGLDDRFEVLVGWDVETLLNSGRVRSRCDMKDSDLDQLSDRDEAPAIINYDAAGLVVFNDGISAPRSVSLATTSGSPIIQSASADFTFADVGAVIADVGAVTTGPRIPENTKILSVQSSSQATMTANATATASGVSAVIKPLYTEDNAPRRDTSGSRTVTDLTTTTGSASVTSASADLRAGHVGMAISGPGIPENTTIFSVQSATEATMTANATATASNVSASIGGSGVDAAIYDPKTDPMGKDTDLDGLTDWFELTRYKNALNKPERRTSPEHADSDSDQLTDGVERKLEADPRFDDRAEFWDSDRDGLTDAEEIADDNHDFKIDGTEIKANAGWGVVVTQMHPRLGAPTDPYAAVARIDDSLPANKRHLVDKGQSLQVGTIVDIKDEQSQEAALNTSVDMIEPASGDDAYVTFGAAFNGKVGLNIYRTVCKNGTCPAQHSTVTRTVYSSKYDPDTDDDGLTDFEESKLGTDPGCAKPVKETDILTCRPDEQGKDSDEDGVRDGWDTDGDGLTDFQEVRGFKLADGSTVKTKPANVDTDNDRRSDGDETGQAGGEFIVRLPGGTVYQASTNPTRADTDFDMLVDGDEQTYGIDPTLPNTDKDNRTDYSEILAGRRPEVPDMLVRMEFIRLYVEKDAEGGGDAGDFRFQFNVVRPDTSQELVVHSERATIGAAAPLPLGQLGLPWSKPDGSCPNNNHEDRCFVTLNGITIIRIIDGNSLPFGLDGKGRVEDIGSVSTIDAVPESFGVRGFVEERDNTDHTKTSCRVEIFPDVFGSAQDGTGLVLGSDLRLGVQSMAITRSVTNCAEAPDLTFTLVVSYTAE